MEEFDDEFGDLSQFKTLSFEEVNQGFTRNNAFTSTIINKDDSPDYRSPFHDYRNTPLGYSYLTDNPVSVFASTGTKESKDMSIKLRYYLVKMAHKYWEVIMQTKGSPKVFFFFMKNQILKNPTLQAAFTLPRWEIILSSCLRDFLSHYHLTLAGNSLRTLLLWKMKLLTWHS